MYKSRSASLHKLLFSTGTRRFWIMQFVYLTVSCLFVLLFLWLPENKSWLDTTIHSFYQQRQNLGKRTDIESRKRAGYGAAYTYTNLIRQRCKPTNYLLIPPQRYLIRKAYRQGAATGYAWIYPSVLYYHLGKSVHFLEMTNPDSLIRRATYTFWASKNQLTLLPITAQNRALVLAEFRKYDPYFFAYTPQPARAYYKTSKP